MSYIFGKDFLCSLICAIRLSYILKGLGEIKENVSPVSHQYETKTKKKKLNPIFIRFIIACIKKYCLRFFLMHLPIKSNLNFDIWSIG